MTLYPHAKWRPLAATQPMRMPSHDLIILHTMVMSLWQCDSYFRAGGYGGVESHFGVGHDGEVLQWTDLDCKADANYQANENAISIETADRGTGFPDWDPMDGSQVPAWTDAQIEAIAQIVAWCCDHYDIPCVLVPDSKPGRRGIGWHRQGVESAPPYQRGYRVPGGELWSTSTGKVCPGSRRIAQIPQVIKRAQAILAGGAEGDWFDMATKAELEAVVRAEVSRGLLAYILGRSNVGYSIEAVDLIKSLPVDGVLQPSFRALGAEVDQAEELGQETVDKLDQLLAGE